MHEQYLPCLRYNNKYESEEKSNKPNKSLASAVFKTQQNFTFQVRHRVWAPSQQGVWNIL